MEKQKVLSYAEQLEAEFMRLYYELDVPTAPEKRKPFIIDSIWMDLYPLIFKPDNKQINNTNSKIMYHDIQTIESIVDMYIKLCFRFNGVIKYNAFCNLTGIDYSTICLWYNSNKTDKYIFSLNNSDIEIESNSINYIYIDSNNVVSKHNNVYYINNSDPLSKLRFDVKKKLHKFMIDENTDGLSGDTVGYTIRANNDEDLGKLYDPKKIVLQQQAKTASLSINDLKLLE